MLLQFINHFNIVNVQIEDSKNIYKKDKNRADKTWKLFKNALDEIRKLLISATLKSKQFKLFKEKIFSSKLINYSISCYNNHKHSSKSKKSTKNTSKKRSHRSFDNNSYSIIIPINDTLFVKYQFVSFSPLQIQKSIVHK